MNDIKNKIAALSRIFIVSPGIIFLVACGAGDGEVVQGEDGMYWSAVDSYGPGQIVYQVDTITQNCFAIYDRGTRSGITEISCAALAKRREWQPIMKWVVP